MKAMGWFLSELRRATLTTFAASMTMNMIAIRCHILRLFMSCRIEAESFSRFN